MSSTKTARLDEEVVDILGTLDEHHDNTFGFVIYRCTYDDQEKWSKFLRRLEGFIEVRIARRVGGEKLKDHFTWDIREDPSIYQNATKSEIRGHFNDWVTSVKGARDLTRYAQCIYVDNEVVNAVLDGEEPHSTDLKDLTSAKGYVKIINSEFTARPNAMFRQGDGTTDVEDEEFEAIEGDRREDVGWMKVAAAALVPRAYAVMLNFGWSYYYARPPVVQAN